jgi:hypothetical protein
MTKSGSNSPIFSLWGGIFVLILWVIPSLGYGADLLQEGQRAPAPVIYFDNTTSIRLLEEVEECRILEEEILVLREYNHNLLKTEKIHLERISDLEASQEELRSLAEEAARNAKLAREQAGGRWYEKIYRAGKWIGIGILVGFAAGNL